MPPQHPISHNDLIDVLPDQHHYSGNDPDEWQKQALIGSHLQPSLSNPYVTSLDPRLLAPGAAGVTLDQMGALQGACGWPNMYNRYMTLDSLYQVHLDRVSGAVRVDSGGILTLHGRGFLPFGLTFDELTVTQGDAGLKLYLLSPGDSKFRFRMFTTESFHVDFGWYTPDYPTMRIYLGGSRTADEIATLINAPRTGGFPMYDNSKGLVRAVSLGGTFTSDIDELEFAGGIGDYWAITQSSGDWYLANFPSIAGQVLRAEPSPGPISDDPWTNTCIRCYVPPFEPDTVPGDLVSAEVFLGYHYCGINQNMFPPLQVRRSNCLTLKLE